MQQENAEKDSPNSWKLYQQWCKMDSHTRECWVNAGKTIQTFTKLSNAKLQDAGRTGNHAPEGVYCIIYLNFKINFNHIFNFIYFKEVKLLLYER